MTQRFTSVQFTDTWDGEKGRRLVDDLTREFRRLDGEGVLLQRVTDLDVEAFEDTLSGFRPGSVSTVLRLTAAVAAQIAGVDASIPRASDGTILLVNVGAEPITLLNEDGAALEPNRILTSGADVSLLSNELATIIYDETSLRWRIVSKSP